MKNANGKHQKEKKMNKKLKIVLITLFSLIFIISIIYIIFHFYTQWKNEKDMQELANWINETDTVENIEESDADKNDKALLEKLKELQKENSDLIGWLKLEDTNIDYPVVQTTDNDYYVRRSFKKKYSELGTIFLDMDCSVTKPTANFLIYGHRSKGGQMFETLTKYKEESFYKEHKTFKFSTLDEVSEYKIIAVFQSKIYYENQDVFKFYFFKDAKNEEEFNNYIENIKKISMYEIEDTATYGDQLITLTTCDYYVENGRFAVVAKKIK